HVGLETVCHFALDALQESRFAHVAADGYAVSSFAEQPSTRGSACVVWRDAAVRMRRRDSVD
ncbi:MAG: hypothetical protein ACPIOQ_27970, partial [Promethearchaeia archaeon]